MNAPTLSPVARAQAAQSSAADPASSAWVSASAGSGKTKLLTDRILRLLLGGTAPGKILCLTFTKAGAAEMANRLNARLAEWAAWPEPKLAAALLELTGAPADAALQARARKMLATVLDAPGGLPIGTIHSFCQALLRRFPLEAGVAPYFALMEPRDAAEARTAAREATLAEADQHARFTLDRFAQYVLGERVGRTLDAVLAEGFVLPTPAAVEAVLRTHLGLGAQESEAGVIEDACQAVDEAALRRAKDALLAGKVTDQKRGQVMADWLAGGLAARVAGWDDLARAFLTKEGEPFAVVATKDVLAANPWLPETIGTATRLVQDSIDRRRKIALAEATAALVRLAHPLREKFAAAKQSAGSLDYADLIEKADRLLRTIGPAWVLFKLDERLDHLLIDEAQDTNPAQWAIASALTGEFFAGLGARDAAPEAPRTVFAVGDVKQSIFGFQGARPEEFSRAREKFGARARAAGQEFRDVELDVSFRSSAPVLALVDAVFQGDARAGVVEQGKDWRPHLSARPGQAGRVELWPVLHDAAPPEAVAWGAPEPTGHENAETQLARSLARTIAAAIGEVDLASRGRRLRPGDVLVLVRRRNAFVEKLVRALQREDVPVAGVDRMVLPEQIAAQDLMAFGHALLLPEDALNLAAVLKGPFGGLSEDSLMELAAQRGERESLMAALTRRAGEQDDWARAEALLAKFRARADQVPPHTLYSELLHEAGGRMALLSRLGAEAADPIEEFLEAALAHERAHAPGLQGFLHWLRAGAAEIKRETEAGRDEVRVMTVHAAKGLQAPWVILPDCCTMPPGGDGVLALEDGTPLWAPRKSMRDTKATELVEALRLRDLAEHRRLLYVAMTRAEDFLTVCGHLAQNRKAAPDESWYALVQAGFAALDGATEEEFGGWEGMLRALETAQEAAPDRLSDNLAAHALPAGLPAWAGRLEDAQGSAIEARRLRPSRADDETEPPAARPAAVGGDAGRRFRRGGLIHTLLQYLPGLPQAARPAAAQRWLASAAHGLAPAEIAEIAAETLTVLNHPGFAEIFAADALAEVPIVGRIGGRTVNGQIDRLLVRPDRILIADFKTNRPPPERVEDVAPLYLRQMAAYRALLSALHPGRPVSCALVWTYAARLMVLPPALLDAALPAGA
jgi:ATP-dependent helicase/nuclease subunit A